MIDLIQIYIWIEPLAQFDFFVLAKLDQAHMNWPYLALHALGIKN